MTRGMLRAGCLALIAVLAVASCRSGPRDENQPTGQTAAAPAAPGPAAVQTTGSHLIAFDLVKGPSAQLVGTFTKTGAGSWTGPHPATGQTVNWSARSDAASVVLYTEDPQITTILLYTDPMDISSSAMDPAENFAVARAVFQ